MKRFLPTACALITLAMAGSAFADGTVTATLANPVPAKTELIAAHAVFKCHDTTCVAAAAPDGADDAWACQDLARQVGQVISYAEFKPLDGKALTKCNKVARTPRVTTASAH